MERELPDEQACFRRERGCQDQVANLRWIMEKAREYQKDLILCFIDFSKVFDCVDHNVIWNTLISVGYPDHIIVLIKRAVQEPRGNSKN